MLKKTEHGCKHIIDTGNALITYNTLNHLQLAIDLVKEESYQARMLTTYVLGILALKNETALNILDTQVASDENWRVQEMLVKHLIIFAGQLAMSNLFQQAKTRT